jgi:RND family efflux transporter MFP subunit
MKKNVCRVLAALLACALMMTGCSQKETTEQAGPSGIAVQVETVVSDTIATENKVSGAISADNETMIMVASAAKCIAVYAHAGDTVTAGQKICKLDVDATLSNQSAAQISYRSAVQARTEQMAVLNAQVALQQKTLDTTKALFEIGAASQIEVESAQLQYASAVAQRNSTQGQLDAAVQQAKAGLEQLGMALDHMDNDGNVISPVDGTLVTMNATENNYVSNAMPVAIVHGNDAMKITVSVSEALVPHLNTGDVADVYVSAADKSFPATIRSVERAANMQTRLYTVVLDAPEDVEGLISGMFANVTFRTNVSENALIIPSNAILTSNDVQYVFVVEDNVAHRVDVTTGLTGSGVTEVLSGLEEGQQLVTVGQAYLADGDAVRIVGDGSESVQTPTAEEPTEETDTAETDDAAAEE